MKRKISSFLKRTKSVEKKLFAPVSGTAIPITEVKDEVFSKKVLGDGIAIRIDSEKKDTVVSPVNGKISFVADTIHGIGITADDGMELLIHIGVDTVNLNGKGFSSHIKEGQKVSAGTPLCTVDFPYIKENGYETDIIMVIADEENDFKISQYYFGAVTAEESCVLEYV